MNAGTFAVGTAFGFDWVESRVAAPDLAAGVAVGVILGLSAGGAVPWTGVVARGEDTPAFGAASADGALAFGITFLTN